MESRSTPDSTVDSTPTHPPSEASALVLQPGPPPQSQPSQLRPSVDDQDGPWVAQMFEDIGAQVIADRIRIPLCAGQQALHAVGAHLARMFRQLPAVLALDRAAQSVHRAAHSLTLFRPGEAWPDPLLHLVYGETSSTVKTVIVDGRVVVEHGKVTTIDEEALQQEIRAISCATWPGYQAYLDSLPTTRDVMRLFEQLYQVYQRSTT